jgi:16S rRNA (cytidine1402-2'-O)-methyltransferase
MRSFHIHNEHKALDSIVSQIEDLVQVGLVSDAGTPGISDPGTHIVGKVRERFGDDVRIETIPGPSALTAALAISGMSLASFVFLGFLPQKKGRQTIFQEIAASERTTVFYESPHRIQKTLETLDNIMPDRTIGIARELTKIHEEYVHGTPKEVILYFAEHPDRMRGEFVVMVSGL